MVNVNKAKRGQGAGGGGGCCRINAIFGRLFKRLRADLSEAAVKISKFFPVVGNLAAMPTISGRIARYRGTQNTDNSPQKNALWCCCPTNSPGEDR